MDYRESAQAGHGRNVRVHEVHQAAKNARFRLAAKPEQDEVMLGKNGVDHLRNHGVFVAVNAGKKRVARLHFAEKIFAHFLANRSLGVLFFRPIAAAKFAESARKRSHWAPLHLDGGKVRVRLR